MCTFQAATTHFNIEKTISSMLCNRILVSPSSLQRGPLQQPGGSGFDFGFAAAGAPMAAGKGQGRHRRREKTSVKNRHDIPQTGRERRAEIPDSPTRAGETCHRLEDYLDDLLDASFDGIVISDAEGNVLKANRAYQKLSNIAREEIVGHNLGDMVRDKVLRGAVVFEVTRTRVPTTRIHAYDRTGKVAMVTGSPVFDDQGTLIYVVANFRDVTQLRKLSKNLGRSSDPFAYSETESFYLKPDLAELPDYGILVRNAKMKACLHQALRVARFDTPVLILGESGVGKTKLAQIIHQASQRSRKPFISINCGSIPENLLESELFGYEKGAFTGANVQGKVGQFELAAGGTLVLEEIGDLSFPLQVKLLQAIDEKRIPKIGGKNSLQVDVRLIAVTNRDLKRMVTEGQFRNDLYFRLNVVPITVPALRERSDEIPLLVRYFFLQIQWSARHDKISRRQSATGSVPIRISWERPGTEKPCGAPRDHGCGRQCAGRGSRVARPVTRGTSAHPAWMKSNHWIAFSRNAKNGLLPGLRRRSSPSNGSRSGCQSA